MLVHIKLKTSEDLVAYVVDESINWIQVSNPIVFDHDPHNGLFAKEWIMLSDPEEVRIDKVDIFFIYQASKDTEDYYTQFMNRYQTKVDSEEVSELENMYRAYLESKASIKH